MKDTERDVQLKIPWTFWIIGAALVSLLLFLLVRHFNEAKQFARVLERAQPEWVAVAVALQIGTYISAGAIWQLVAHAASYRLRVRSLARLAIVKLTVDHLVPTGGMSGNLVVVRAIKRLGLPAWVGMEALLVDIFAHYAAFAVVALATLGILQLYKQVTPVILSLLGLFSLVSIGVLLALWWLLEHRDWKPPRWIRRRHLVRFLLEAVRDVSPERIHAPQLIAKATMFQLTIVLLDSATLWAMMRAIGEPVSIPIAFVALAVASMAGAVSFLPGGIGGFEAGCTAILTLSGLSVEAALTGTLLLRGLTLWLPLIPGIILARHELAATQT